MASFLAPPTSTGKAPRRMLSSYKRMGVDMRVTVPRVIILLVVLLVLAELISYFSTSNGTDWQVFLAASVNFFILFLFFAFFVGAILFIFGRIKLPNCVEGKVKKLAKLKEAGIITEEEFEARKNKLLDQL